MRSAEGLSAQRESRLLPSLTDIGGFAATRGCTPCAAYAAIPAHPQKQYTRLWRLYHFCGFYYPIREVIPIAIYHCNISIVSRGKGKSAVAAAAYRSGEKLTNEWDGMTHDYTRKGGVVHGYLKAPDNCHQLIVDPVAAEVVKTMFQWAAEGAGLNTIAVRLNEAGYLSPSHYKRTLGEITHENLVGNGHWQTRTVAKILRAEVYTGDLVQGVSKIIDHKQVRASADEWTTVRGTHEAIISRELFAAVQKALDQAAQQAKDREIHSWSPNLLRGKIFCAHCGHSLHRQKCVRRKSQEVYVYHCISNNRIKKGVCPGVFIFEKELLDALADVIQEQLDTTLGQYSLGLENLSKEAEEQKNIQAKIASRKQEIQQLRTYQRGLYEGLIQNHLSKDEYFSFKEKYEAKIEAISEEIEQLKAGLAILAKQLEQYKMLSQDAQHIKEDRQLTAALIDRLIDRIEVSREKRITVRFRFQSEFEHCEEVLSQCRNM